MSDIILEIAEWNEDRDNLHFDGANEFDMLAEELDEFAWALPKSLQDKFGEMSQEEAEERMEELTEYLQSDEGRAAVLTNQLDALADLVFVAVGSMIKLTKDFRHVEDVFHAVIAANNLKGKDKENGKITKPVDFVGPESIINKIALEVLDGS